MNSNITWVVKAGLCTGCGTCAGVCPNNAVKLTIDGGVYLPKILERYCNSCGVCADTCPGHSMDFSELNIQTFGERNNNGLLGKHKACYIGHSNNSLIRYNSSSGGIVTELSLLALEEDLVDGVLVTRMKKNAPLEPEPLIARTRTQIISASKSKYCPVPANIALKHITRQNGRFAVVGLPCHIHGIRKAEALDRRLKEKIILHLGLFCSHTVSFTGTKVLLHKFGVSERLVKKLDYRGKGWPGNLSISLLDNQVIQPKEIDFRKTYWNPLFGPYFFTPLRCMCCIDMTNELADLSFGDAWLKEIIEKDRMGASIIISRNEIGEELLKNAEKKGRITIKKISSENIIRSQLAPLTFKKVDISSRLAILQKIGKATPKYQGVKYCSTKPSHLVSLLQLFDTYISSRKIGRLILENIPLKILRVWGAFIFYLELLSFKKLIEVSKTEQF